MSVEDLGGLGKLASTKLANKIYDDALAPSAKELGKFGEDCLKAFRYFTRTIQLVALRQDQFEGILDEVRDGVPEEQRIEAPPSVAGPVIQNMVFLEDGNPLLEMYKELLKRAIDRERVGEAHPAFPRIIEQLSPDEAMLLWELKTFGHRIMDIVDPRTKLPASCHEFVFRYIKATHYLDVYLNHVKSLNLIDTNDWHDYLHYRPYLTGVELPDSTYDAVSDGNLSIASLTTFGDLFAKACIPAEWPEAEEHHSTE